MLARREYSRQELQRRLAPHAGEAGELEQLLDDLARRGWLSELRVAEQVIHARRARFGSGRIRQELLKKGVPEEVVAAELPQLRDGDLEAARAVWRRRFGTLPRNAAERARQVRFMQGRGFGLDTILNVIKSVAADDEGI